MNRIVLAVITVLITLTAGCATAPPTQTEQVVLQEKAESTLAVMKKLDPTLDRLLQDAHGYVVFPAASKGGLIAGAGYGRGIAYEKGVAVGYADITQATVGGQIGAQTFSELVVLQDKAAMDRFKSGKVTFETNLSAVALDNASATRAVYKDGIIVFIRPEGGLMAEAVVGGQQFTFVPLGENR